MKVSGLRARLSKAYVDSAERGPRHPALYPAAAAVLFFFLFLAIGLASGNGQAGAIWAVLVIAYWLPSLVAWGRRVRKSAQVLIVNLFLGWTFIGWVVALVMASGSRAASQQP